MWKNFVERCRPQITIWRMSIARWIPKVTNTHSEYAILIAFPWKQWMPERETLLHYMCFVFNINNSHRWTHDNPHGTAEKKCSASFLYKCVVRYD